MSFSNSLGHKTEQVKHGDGDEVGVSSKPDSPVPYFRPSVLKTKGDREMSKKLEEIISEAMELGLQERAQLAGTLLASLDEPSGSEVERLWLQEAERRLQEYREGKVKGIPAEEVFNRALADIS